MSEPYATPNPVAAPGRETGLWEAAPAWRRLTFVATGLTIAAGALALPPLLQPSPAPPPAVAAAPRPPGGPGAPPLYVPSGAPPATPTTPTAPAAPAPAPQSARSAPQTAGASSVAQASATQLASAAAPKTAAAPQPTPAAQPPVCMLAAPPTPAGFGVGVVSGFEDHAASLARIQITQRTLGGLIDPNYVDNQRIMVRMRNGRGVVVLLPKGMTVQLGDRVAFQGGYRNMALPCNYIPTLVTADLGPPPPASAAGASAPPAAGADPGEPGEPAP